MSPEAGTAEPWKSVAEPENDTVSPTFQRVPAVGVAMVAVGGLPAVMVSVSVSTRPLGSVTRRRTV